MIFIYVADNPRPDELPPPRRRASTSARGSGPKFIVHQTFNAHMDDAVVGLMDPAYVPFVHNQWWWRPPCTGLRLKEKPLHSAERGWALARHAPIGQSCWPIAR